MTTRHLQARNRQSVCLAAEVVEGRGQRCWPRTHLPARRIAESGRRKRKPAALGGGISVGYDSPWWLNALLMICVHCTHDTIYTV